MKTYSRQPETKSDIAQPKASKQASAHDVLQAYKGKIVQRQEIDEDELLQGKFGDTAQLLQNESSKLLERGNEDKLRQKLAEELRIKDKRHSRHKGSYDPEGDSPEKILTNLTDPCFDSATKYTEGKAVIQREVIVDEDELLQGKFDASTAQHEEISMAGGEANNTGMPDNLKSGIESLSGYSMDDVRVHYNSSKPAQLQALAYAQGTDIHIAPGQEQHLPHEAWHVVQQMQGRVQPTTQLQGVNVNDNEGLEKEADVMGRKAVQMKNSCEIIKSERSIESPNVIQYVGGNTVGCEEDDQNMKNLIKDARIVNKADKECCTEANEEVLKDIDIDIRIKAETKNQKKTHQIKEVYAKYLLTINLDKVFIKIVNKDIQNKNAAKDYLEKKERVDAQFNTKFKEKISTKDDILNSIERSETIPEETIDNKIKEGEEAFERKGGLGFLDKDGFVDTYRKKGKEKGIENNEYIKDDFGNFIRRYAYMEKSIYQLMNFAENAVISGQTQDIKRAAGMLVADIDPLSPDNEDFGSIEKYITEIQAGDKAGGDNNLKKKIAIAYLHQWKGSGFRQRGLSLTATSKDNAVFGNSGESFRSADGAKFKIDLALVKLYDPNNLLLSHYHISSPTRVEEIRQAPKSTNANSKEKRKEDSRNKYKYDVSVIKNRELYLQYLPEEGVVGISVHGDKEYKSMSEFRQSQLYMDYIGGKEKGLAGAVDPSIINEIQQKGKEYGVLIKRGKDAAVTIGKIDTITDVDKLIQHVFEKMKESKEYLAYWVGYTEKLRELNLL